MTRLLHATCLVQEDHVDLAGTAAVLCGQKAMTEEVTELLRRRGVDAILLNF